jgi:hypothetical protein
METTNNPIGQIGKMTEERDTVGEKITSYRLIVEAA